MPGFPKIYPTHAVVDWNQEMVYHGSLKDCHKYITNNSNAQLKIVSFSSLNIMF